MKKLIVVFISAFLLTACVNENNQDIPADINSPVIDVEEITETPLEPKVNEPEFLETLTIDDFIEAAIKGEPVRYVVTSESRFGGINDIFEYDGEFFTIFSDNQNYNLRQYKYLISYYYIMGWTDVMGEDGEDLYLYYVLSNTVTAEPFPADVLSMIYIKSVIIDNPDFNPELLSPTVLVQP